MSDPNSSTPNWPIAGGEYKNKTVPGMMSRVRSIEAGRVHFDREFRGQVFTASPCRLDTFRDLHSPEDQSPIPALVAALKQCLEYGLAPTGDGSTCWYERTFADARLALALAGEPSGEEQS